MRRTSPTAVAVLTLVLALGACASSGATSGTTATTAHLPDRITAAEIAGTSGTSAYDLISQLRPRWLKLNTPGSLSGLSESTTIVYLDGNKMGGLETLRSIGAAGITSMQYLDAVKAATMSTDASSDPTAGAILIVTRH